MTDSTDNAPERIAFRKAYMSHAITSGPLMDHADYVQYLRADLAPDPLDAVRIKPLEWDDVQAETPFGTYDFGYVGRVWTLRFCGNQIEYGIAGNYRTARAEAKEAAKHHFATRILSTLKPTGVRP